jgi:adenylyltransferase/sulfurtransferase
MTDLPLEIPVTDAAAALRGSAPPLLLDCRTPEEHQTARIAGAVLIPMQELPERVAELAGQEAASIIVHCHHGMRSLRVATWLRDRGFTKAQSMAGGIDAWSEQVDPTVPKY